MLVELHCHSNHSDGIPSVREIMHKADKMLGAIAIADHNTMAGYKEAKKLGAKAIIIPAVEVTCRHHDRNGHIIALGIEEIPKGNAFEVLDFIRENGGLSIIAHPFRGLVYSFNQREIWKRADAIEVLNGNTMTFKNNKAYAQAKIMGMPMTSGSDAHWIKFVGKYACEIEGDSLDSILNAIKKNKVILPVKSTNAFSILYHGTVRRSTIKLKKIIGKKG